MDFAITRFCWVYVQTGSINIHLKLKKQILQPKQFKRQTRKKKEKQFGLGRPYIKLLNTILTFAILYSFLYAYIVGLYIKN